MTIDLVTPEPLTLDIVDRGVRPVRDHNTGNKNVTQMLYPASRAERIIGHILLILLSFVAVFPIYWMFSTSLKPANEINQLTVFPQAPTLDNYAFVWQSIPIVRILGNTFLVAGVETALQLLTSLLAAYAFARWKFFGNRFLYALFAFTWLVPFQTTMIPNYVLVYQLGWLDSLAAIIVPQLGSAFAVILLMQAVKGFPSELIDASRCDGASNWGVLWRIILPNLRAILATLGVLLFISGWNDYFWPLLITRHIENSVIQMGLSMFFTQEGNLWGPLMAASSLASLPILAIYLLLQRQVIDSFVRSGLRA